MWREIEAPCLARIHGRDVTANDFHGTGAASAQSLAIKPLGATVVGRLAIHEQGVAESHPVIALNQLSVVVNNRQRSSPRMTLFLPECFSCSLVFLHVQFRQDRAE